MGNWHCIPSSCARVVYYEYLPPVVRWRYEGENWNEIEADDYAIEQLPGQCEGINYRMFFQEWRPNIKDPSGPLIKFGKEQIYGRNSTFIGKIDGWYITDNDGNLLVPEQLKLKVRSDAKTKGFKLLMELIS